MNQKLQRVDMGFTEETLPVGTHMCMIYSDDKERLDLIPKFFNAGIKAGEKLLYLVDTMSPEDFLKFLNENGVKVPENGLKDQLTVTRTEDSYCQGGHFITQRMLDFWRDLYIDGKKAGFSNLRGSGEMTWSVISIPGSEQLVEYEAALNDLFSLYPITVICQYDANKFDGGTILNILKVHPMMIVHGQIVQNPYYIPPQEFLKSYKVKDNQSYKTAYH